MSFPFEVSALDTEDREHASQPRVARAAMDSLRRVVRALRASNAGVEREHRLSAAQLFVLRQVAERPGQSLNELAQRTLTTQSTVSEVVGRLVQHGMIARESDARDRRRVLLTLSDIGRDVLSRAPETVQERLVQGFQTLSPAMQSALADGLDAWLSAAGLRDVPPTMFLED
jgi:DNA-binding MarR family transcriptional regulator